MGVEDRDSATGSLDDTNSHQLTVSASNSDAVFVMVDDGTAGNTPSNYDIKLEGYSAPTEEDRFKFYSERTGVTDRSWQFDAVGSKARVTVTNQSGGSATFDVTVESRSTGET